MAKSQSYSREGNNKMAIYEFITGELVSVEAESLEEAELKLAEGYYDFLEAITELRAETNE